ncbi:hypothetical protein [Geotoga petraea]|jgi:hypothetical protein|uniref:Uncharacterized protein n=1 Tax=Geotoga petraea TaxID=28234 RepID=A0A1G6LT46_9BACT|nr:hypothetical protein [Geotoga petraea]SDC46468.1 hypothetical protein SAMN04488588_1139 [Geotoga petraea]
MYNELLDKIKNDLSVIKNNDILIFDKVTKGATKSDDDLNVASIFLANSNHGQLTSRRYETEPTINLVCIFNKKRDDLSQNELFLQRKYSDIEVIEDYFKQNFVLTNTEFSEDNNGLYVMITFKTSEVKAI